MNFKFKAVVAAGLAALAMSGSANALVNNELFLIAYDSTSGSEKTLVSALADFASVTTASTGAVGFTKTITNTDWSNFYTAANAGNITWSVLGVNGNGMMDVSDRIAFTSSSPQPIASKTNVGIDAITLAAVNSGSTLGQFLSTNTATGNLTTVVSGTGAGSGLYSGDSFFSLYPQITTSSALNTGATFYSLQRLLGPDGDVTWVDGDMGVVTTLNTFSLSNTGVLTYVAAVPEAETSLMLLAGIGLMGSIVRRRKVN